MGGQKDAAHLTGFHMTYAPSEKLGLTLTSLGHSGNTTPDPRLSLGWQLVVAEEVAIECVCVDVLGQFNDLLLRVAECRFPPSPPQNLQ